MWGVTRTTDNFSCPPSLLRVLRICIARLYGQLIVLLLLHSIKHLNKKTFYTYRSGAICSLRGFWPRCCSDVTSWIMLHYRQSVIVTAIAVVYTGWGQEREGSFLRLNRSRPAFWKWREENLSLNKKTCAILYSHWEPPMALKKIFKPN